MSRNLCPVAVSRATQPYRMRTTRWSKMDTYFAKRSFDFVKQTVIAAIEPAL